MIFRNAFKSIVRAKGRNILIAIIVFVIAIASCISLSIKNAAKSAQTAAIESIVITANISTNREKLMDGVVTRGSSGEPDREKMQEMQEQMRKYGDLELTELEKYADSEYVKEFYYSNSLSLNASDDLEAYGAEDSSSSDSSGTTANEFGGNFDGGIRGGGSFVIGGMSMGDFTVTGYSSESAMTDFISGSSKITDGEMFDLTSDEKTCLVSNELAVYNALALGDSITLENPNAEDETYTFKIVGIYTNTNSQSSNMPRFGTAMDPANLICVSSKALEAVITNSENVATTETDDNGNESSSAMSGSLTGTYSFSSEADYEAFKTQVTEKGLSEYYAVNSPDADSYEASIKPLESLSSTATKLLIIVFVIGAVILIVLNLFNIRERKYEVGVLTAIGIKKRKVALQFVTELLAVTLVAILLGAAVGAVASVPVANSMLESQVAAQEAQASSQEQNFGRGPVTSIGGGPVGAVNSIMGSGTQNVTYLDEINATANLTVVLQLIALGLCLTILSSFVAVVFVLRYEPLKILANRV